MEEEKKEKKVRKRTKNLLNLLQKQLEFYFGDANLRHDRFLRKEVESDANGYVSFELMLKFNKMKQLTSDLSMLKKAAENSNQFQVNENGQTFKRVQPLPELIDADQKTVYVEQLHAYCDHEWLSQVFSICGTVEYISLPRYKHNNQIKGFAFIEFSNEEEAEKACQMLNTAAPRKNKQKKQRQSSTENKNNESVNGEKRKRKRSISCTSDVDIIIQKEAKTLLKRRRRSSSLSVDGSPIRPGQIKVIEISKKSALTFTDNKDCLVKKVQDKTEDERDKESEGRFNKLKRKAPSGETDITNKKKYKEDSDSDSCKENIGKLNENESKEGILPSVFTEKEKKKKNRQHRKKNESGGVKEISVPPLYVISKGEWLSLKKQYQKLQKKEMRDLKRTTKILKSEKVKQKELKEKMKIGEQNATKTKSENKNITNGSDHNITDSTRGNKVVQNNANNGIKEEVKKNGAAKSLDMKPGTVVQLQTTIETLNKKSIINELSTKATVTYVDYVDGSTKGFIRFPSREIALQVLNEDFTNHKFSLSCITEQEEQQYFAKALEDRKKKYEQNQKKKNRKNKRGIDKVTEKSVQNHIHFE